MAPVPNTLFYATLDTFVGEVLVAATPRGVVRVAFQRGLSPCDVESTWVHAPQDLVQELEQLRAYFDGSSTGIELHRHTQGTPFQEQVWDRVSGIPYGQNASYGALAKELNRHNGARAVGQANARNPVPLLVPCHRVIASGGQLTGFSGGLDIKTQLIEHERRVRPQARTQLGLFG